MMFKRILLLSLAAALLSPLPAMASFYIGGSIGNTWQSDTPDQDEVLDQLGKIDENSTGYKFFGGYKGSSFLGIEGGYRDLGKIELDAEGVTFHNKTTGWDVEAIGHLEISIVDLFAKAGAFFWSNDSAYGLESESVSGTSFLWGLGAGVSLGSVGIRLEWESMEVSELDNLSLLSLGVTLGF